MVSAGGAAPCNKRAHFCAGSRRFERMRAVPGAFILLPEFAQSSAVDIGAA
jgi:hypothetical protein